jgi:hypothetical protein
MLEHVWQTNGGDITKFPEKDKVIYAKSYGRPGVMREAFEYFRAFNDKTPKTIAGSQKQNSRCRC